mgnify:CR=1 FL=1
MFCVECGKEIPNGVKFCPECGASQIVKVEEKPAKAKPKRKTPKKKESVKQKNNKSGKKKNTKVWENFQILIWSMPGIIFLFITIGIGQLANSTDADNCSDKSFGCMEIALYGLCLAITNIFLAFNFVKKPEASQNVFLSVFVVIALIVIGGLFLESGALFQVKTLGICMSLLIILIVIFAISNNESKIEAAGHAWLMLTVLGAIFAIILYVILF